MKRLFAVWTAFVLTLSLTACDSSLAPGSISAPDSSSVLQKTETSSAHQSSSAEVPENEPAPSSNVPESTSSEGSSSQLESVSSLPEPSSSKTEAQTEETEGKALVVYFSHTGTTEGAANEIAAQTGADVFEIVPTETYTSDYNTLLDIAQRELDENARPVITGSVEDISQYNTIYLGWPCWWSDMPMVVCTFLDSCDLSGKPIAPFVPSGGSGFGSALSRLREMEPGATVTEGLSLRGSGSSEAVIQWLNSIGLAE